MRSSRRIARAHAVQHLDVQRVFVQQRRRRVPPLQPKTSVLPLDIAHPELVACEIERFQDAGAGHHPHVAAVGHRRGRRHVLLHHARVAAAEGPFPERRAAGAIDGPQVHLAAVRHVEAIDADPVAFQGDGIAQCGRSHPLLKISERGGDRIVEGEPSTTRQPGGAGIKICQPGRACRPFRR